MYLKQFDGSPSYRSQTYPTVVEGVYSWRTGRSAESDPAPSPPTREPFDDWGIRTPSQKGNLFEQLSDRKRYTEEVMRSAFPAETATGSVSTTRASQTDSGHIFSKVTCSRWPLMYDMAVQSTQYPYGRMSGQYYVSDTDYAPVVPSGSGGYFSFGAGEKSLLSSTQRQAMHNRYFQSTAPSMQNASLMVTLLELAKGDVPSLLRNFRRSVYKHSAARYLGGEALNIMFGWSPIIRDYAGMIKTFLTIDRMIYGETSRRHRQWDGPSSTVTTYNSVNPDNTFRGHLGTFTGTRTMLTVGTFYLELTETMSENYRYSSRYSSIAKPSSKSNAFADRALEVLRQLGLVDTPTLVWELLPWSWLVDWALDLSSSLTNANLYSPIAGKYAVDYAYVTTQATVTRQERVLSFTKVGGNTIESMVPLRKQGYMISTARTRDRATPFGFGIQLGSLNATQWGILVALGLAKSR